jgi:Zn-dependent M28 family amino/carboxypeptidase
VGRNLRGLLEGLSYLRHKRGWDPDGVKPVDPHGAFGICHDLVHLNNADRGDAIVGCLRDLNLTPIPVAIPEEPLSNVLALLHPEGPYTLFVAHYDKSRETAAYQAASDNTAAVCALLAAARDLAESPPRRPVAFLFTAAEERGCRGAEAFLSWARARGLAMAEVINFDMIGRGKLASRPSALPGYYFWLPGLGEMVYNGRGVARGRPYPSPDPGLIYRLKAVLGDDLVTYRRFTARSDSNVFQAAGIPTVSLSSDDMYYLDSVWERDADRLELLDELNLDLARRLVVDYARRAA